LRDAYHTSLKDPALLEELKKRRWVVDAISGEELAKLAKEVVSQPPRSSSDEEITRKLVRLKSY